MSQVTYYFHRIPQLAVTELVNVCKLFSRAYVPNSWKRMAEHFPQKTASSEQRVNTFVPLAIYECSRTTKVFT